MTEPHSPTPTRSRVAVVTGAGSGIGRAIALRLACDGFVVAVLDADAERAAQTATMVADTAGDSVAFPVDVSDEAAVGAVFARVSRDVGPVEALVTAAGIFDQNVAFDELSARTWQRVIEVNLLGTAHCLRSALDAMRAAGRGAIVT